MIITNDETTDYVFEVKIDSKWIQGVTGELDFVKKYYDGVTGFDARIIKRTIKSITETDIWTSKNCQSS